MEMIKICEGIKISNKVFTKTWRELEKFFGVSITQIGTVYEEKTKTIDDQESLLLILVNQDNNLTKEEMLDLIDHDEDKNVSLFSCLAQAISIFPNANLGEGKKSGNPKK